jgi:hypothetical protein
MPQQHEDTAAIEAARDHARKAADMLREAARRPDAQAFAAVVARSEMQTALEALQDFPAEAAPPQRTGIVTR